MKRTKEGEALTAVILETFKFNGFLLNAGNRLCKPYGLTSARWQVMGAIEIAGQALTVSQIARRMGLSRQGVQRIVNDLSKLEMVTAANNIDHVRAPLINLSQRGRHILEKINRAQIAWVNELAEGLHVDSLENARSVLKAARASAEM